MFNLAYMLDASFFFKLWVKIKMLAPFVLNNAEIFRIIWRKGEWRYKKKKQINRHKTVYRFFFIIYLQISVYQGNWMNSLIISSLNDKIRI